MELINISDEIDKASSIKIMSSVNADGGRILFQPVMMVPVNTTGAVTGRQINYPKMKVIAIRIFSAICIVLGIASIGVHVSNYCFNKHINNLILKIVFEDSGAGDLRYFIIQLCHIPNGRCRTRHLGRCIIFDDWQFGNSGLSKTDPITVNIIFNLIL